VHKATDLEPIVVTANGVPVAKIVPFTADVFENPFLQRKFLSGFAELQETLFNGTDSTEIISEMRDGR
jgi:antitoxin (DNA-binding transcriptional repressor) of toxin-antitoxin stability system